MKAFRRLTLGLLVTATTAHAAVHKGGLYHSSTNLNALTEAVPGLAGDTFLNVDYTNSLVTFVFLTDSPAGDPGETVRARVRLYSTREYLQDAELVTNVVIADTNRFHDTPSTGSITVDVWRATWPPTWQFTGPVYYSPEVLAVNTNTQTTNILYLLRTTGTSTGADWGINDTYWLTNAQVHGLSFDFNDYSFTWTNYLSSPFEWIYFNSTNRATPQAEIVTNLGVPFFDYSYVSNQPSHLYVITPSTGIVSVVARLYYLNGPGEVFTNAAPLTNMVISSSNPFNGLPASGDQTITVWRTDFYPPNNWSNNTVFFAPRVQVAGQTNMWCVQNIRDISDGITASNTFTDAQYFYSTDGGYFGRDWGYTSTGTVTRPSLSLDWAYVNNAANNPLTEEIPSLDGRPFLVVDYARTTTTFYTMTDLPFTLVPGEDMAVKMRITYQDPLSTNGNFVTELRPMSRVTNLVLSSATPFHGLPAAGTHTTLLWATDWPQPSSGGVPLTNEITVYYAPVIQSVAGSLQHETGERYLVRAIEGATNGWGSNNFTAAPQFFGTEPSFHDFSYIHKRLSFDGLYFNNTNGPAPENEAVPGLGGVPFFQYNYGSNQFSYVHMLAPAQGVSSMAVRVFFLGSADEITYNATPLTNVVLATTNQFHGLPTAGAITLAVWRAAFLPPTNAAGNTFYYAPRVTLTNGGSFWMVKHLDNPGNYQGAVNNWPTNPQSLFADPSGFFNRDWSYTPTAAVQRAGVTFDWAYHNNTNRDPESEAVPGLTNTFRQVSYATTTTTFHALTELPFNLVAEESATIRLRVAWTTNFVSFPETTTNMTLVTNLVIDSALPFHGLPASGAHTVQLWRAAWPLPASGGFPITNAVYVFYSMELRTTMGTAGYVTDSRFLLARIDGSTNGWGSNNFTIDPQFFGPDFISHDYFFTSRFPLVDSDGDGLPDLYEDNTGVFVDPQHTGSNPGNPDSDGDRLTDGEEVVAGTDPNNAGSYFRIAFASPLSGGPLIQWNGRSNRIYNVERLDGWPTNMSLYSIVYTDISVATDATISTNLPAGAGSAIIRLRVRGN